MERASALRARLQELRQSFDRAFGEELSARRDDALNLLSIRVGRDRHAVRLSDVAALEVRCAVTPVPSDQPELLGIAGVRGAVVAVFDLAALIGASSDDAPWLLLAKRAPVAFAFGEFEGVWSARSEDLVRAQGGRDAGVVDVALRDGQPVPVIDLAALVEDLERRRRAAPRGDGG